MSHAQLLRPLRLLGILLTLAVGCGDATGPHPPHPALVDLVYTGDRQGIFLIPASASMLDTTLGPFAAASRTAAGDLYVCAAVRSPPNQSTFLILNFGLVASAADIDLPRPPSPGATGYTPGNLLFDVPADHASWNNFELVRGVARLTRLGTDSIGGAFSALLALPPGNNVEVPVGAATINGGTFLVPMVDSTAFPHLCRL
jgi:hypothetical protein